MKLKRFNTVNEAAKKSSKKELEKNSLEFIIGELKKQKMNRYDMIVKIEEKFKDDKDVDKVARKISDEIIHKKADHKVETESYMKPVKKSHYSAAYYWIGDDAKEPTGVTKKGEKIVKKEKKEDKKIDRYSDFRRKKKTK